MNYWGSVWPRNTDFTGEKNLTLIPKHHRQHIQPYYTAEFKNQFQWSPGSFFVPIFCFETVQFCTQKISQPNHGGQSKNNPAIVSTQTDTCSKNISANGKTDYMGWRLNVNGKSHGITAGTHGTQIEKNWGQIKSTQPEGISGCGCWRHLHRNVRIQFFSP